MFIPTFFVFPLIQTIVRAEPIILLNIVLYIIIVLYCYCVVIDIWKNNNIEIYFGIFWTISILVFLFQFLNNPQNLFDFSTYKLIFNPDLRSNFGYNFLSTNGLGALCFGNLVISTFLKPKSKITKSILFCGRVFVILLLLSTGSRTSLICIILYLFMSVLLRKIYKFKKYKNSKNIKIFFVFIFVIVLIVIFNSYSYEEMDKFTSYRLSGWIDSISYILNNFGVFGIGLLNPDTLFGTILRGRLGNRLTADNWYIYMFIANSFVGIISACLIVNSFINICFRALKEENIYQFSLIFSFLISKIFYSLFEISFFTPSDINSIIMIIMIFAFNKKYSCYEYLKGE